MFCLLAGCQAFSKPIAAGPSYALADFPEAAAPHDVVVELTDYRADWERHFYRGSEDPAQYRKGVTFLAAENFRPAPLERVRQIVAERLAALSEPPAWAEVRLKSFRVVDHRERALQSEYQRRRTMTHAERLAERQREFDELQECRRQYRLAVQQAKREGRPPPPNPCPAPDSEYHVGVGVSSDMVGTGGGGLVGVGVIGAALLAGEALKPERILEGPPPELPSTYGPGITCEITATVVLHWTDGRHDEFEVAAAMFAESRQLAAHPGHEVAAVVEAALLEVGQQLAAQLPPAVATGLGTTAGQPEEAAAG